MSKCSCVMSLVGRVLFAVPMIVFGVMHFMNAAEMVSYVPGYLPMPLVLVYLTGLVLVLGGLSLLTNYSAHIGAMALGVLLLLFALLIHLPAVIAGDAGPTNLLKDLALSGAAMFMAGYCCKSSCSSTEHSHEAGGSCCS